MYYTVVRIFFPLNLPEKWHTDSLEGHTSVLLFLFQQYLTSQILSLAVSIVQYNAAECVVLTDSYTSYTTTITLFLNVFFPQK